MLKKERKQFHIFGISLLVISLILSNQIPIKVSAASSSSVEILQEFDMEQVNITDTYYVNAFEKDMDYLLAIDADRLIAGFKAVSEGKDPKTTTGLNLYGGWEGSWSLLRGHTLGHYLTAMAQAYKQTKDDYPVQNAQIKKKIDYIITQLKSFQDKSSTGYLFASLESHFDIIEGKATGDSWVPWYTMHKIIAGLVDVYKYEGNETSLQIASKLGDWTYNRASKWNTTLQNRVENYTKLNDSLYFHNDSELYVNMYLSSTLNWSEKGLSLTQVANLPLSNQANVTINSAPSSSLNIKFRSPSWIASGQEVAVKVNGSAYTATNTNGYLNISRVWKKGDIVELTFPMEVKTSRLSDNQNAVAFTYGPVVLSAGLGTEQMVSTGHMASSKATIPEGVTIKDYILINDGEAVDDWLENIKSNLVQTSGKLEFTLRNTDSDTTLKFTPHYQRYTDRYGIYFILSAQDSDSVQENILNNKKTAKKEEATIDEVQVTNDQFELVHNLQGNSSGGSYGGYNYRHVNGTTDGQGWFSYDMKVDSSVTNYIATKYYSGDAGRTFNVYVDNQLLVEETIKAKNPTSFYDVSYKLPSSMVSGKSKITVKFSNRGNSYVGGVFDSVCIMKDYSNIANLSGITVNGTAASLSDTVYAGAVDANATQAEIIVTPAQKNALVYVDNILIDDTVARTVELSSNTTKLTVKVVAEDDTTTQTYTLNISKGGVSTGTTYEAEKDTTLTSAVAEKTNSGFSGDGYVNFTASSDAAIQWNNINCACPKVNKEHAVYLIFTDEFGVHLT